MAFVATLEIIPRKGLNKLRFGATMLEAEKYFGKPEAIEHINDIEDYKSIVWHYWQFGFSLFFDENLQSTFSCVEVDKVDTLLWKQPVFKMNERSIVKLFKENNYTQLDIEEHEWGERRVSFDDALVDLYFEKGKLISINHCAPSESKKILILPN